MMLKKVIKVIFSCILSLFLAITVLAAGLCHYGYAWVCNPETLQNVAVESSYIDQLYDEIVYDWENYLSITGVETPENIMVVLTREQVSQDALKYLNDAYTGSATIDTQTLRNNLDAKVREYAYSHNIYETPEEELEQNIQDLVDACIDDYTSAITDPMLTKILSTIQRYGSVLPSCIIGLAIGSLLLLVFLFFLQTKKQDTLYYAALSSTTGSILLIAAPNAVAHYNIINRIPFTESALKTLVKGYLHAVTDAIGQYGMIFLITTIALLTLFLITSIVVTLLKRAPKAESETKVEENTVADAIDNHDVADAIDNPNVADAIDNHDVADAIDNPDVADANNTSAEAEPAEVTES